METLIKLVEPSISESVLQETHKDHTQIGEDDVLTILGQALLQEYTDVLDIKLETIDRNYSIKKEILSGDATIRVSQDSPSQRVIYEINADGSSETATYDTVEVFIEPK